MDVSGYALHNAWQDCAEFSLLYAIASARGSLGQLRGHSPERLRLWSWALEQVNSPLHPNPKPPVAEAARVAEAAKVAEVARLEALATEASRLAAEAARLEVLAAEATRLATEAARLEALAAGAARLEALAAEATRLATEAARLEALATEAGRRAQEAATPTAQGAAEQPGPRSRARAPPRKAGLALAVLALALIVALIVALIAGRSTPTPS